MLTTACANTAVGCTSDCAPRFFTSNIRVANQRIGDIRAQAAALRVGQERVFAILDRYGDDTVVAAAGVAGNGGSPGPAQTNRPSGPVKPIVNKQPKVGRNDPCPCGSGKKYKRCHGVVKT